MSMFESDHSLGGSRIKVEKEVPQFYSKWTEISTKYSQDI